MVRVYKPSDLDAGAPALYWIHGGGMVGSVAYNDIDCKGWATDMRCVVASVEYRLAPEHPHPAPTHAGEPTCWGGDMRLPFTHTHGMMSL